MTWTQVYNPVFGSVFASAVLAALPVVVLLGLLAFFHVKAHWAAIAGLATALLVAILVFRMPPQLGLLAAFNGAIYGLFPIGWIVLNAIFVYDITVKTGKFEVVKETIAGLASDRRIQALLIAFSFGAFIEGAAGFGTPVAISAAMLIGLGFPGLLAAGIALIGNTAPVAYGALGTPIITLAAITKLPVEQLSAMAGRQLPFFSVLIPFWLIWAMSGRKAMMEIWPACLTAGVSFAITQFFVSNYIGPSLVDIIASLVSLAAMFVLLRFWQPRTIWRFPNEAPMTPPAPRGGTSGRPAAAPQPVMSTSTMRPAMAGATPSGGSAAVASPQAISGRDALMAWFPWILLSVLVFVWGLPQAKAFMNGLGPTNYVWNIPGLDKMVLRAAPVVTAPEPEAASWTLNWLSATGTALLLTGIISGFVLGLGPGTIVRTYLNTLNRVKFSLITIAAMLALGYTTRYAGLDATMGLAFASTGFLFPFFSPFLGWLGVALTGSDTSSNVLFGNLQQITAKVVGVSPILAAASNSSGGVMGKMIDAQSIVVAGVATEEQGHEGDILRYVFFHSLALVTLVGILVFLQAYVFTWMIPGG